jgi:hypothetical protein
VESSRGAGRSSWSAPGIEMVEDLSDDGGVGDEREDSHRSAALVTGQGVDLVDTVDELGPTLAQSASGRRGGLGAGYGSLVIPVRGAHPVGVNAVEMNQVFIGLRDVNQYSSQELERVKTGLLVGLVTGFGLVEDEPGVRMIAKPGEVDGRAHQITRKLVQSLGVRGVDGGSIVDAEARMPPRKEQVDALLRNEPLISQEAENLVTEESLSSVFVDVGNGHPFAVGRPHPPGGDGVDVGIPF